MEVLSGIKVVDNAIKKIKKQKCSILIMGRKAAETFIFQLTGKLCQVDKSRLKNSGKAHTIFVNFNDSNENLRIKAKRIKWDFTQSTPNYFINMYDKRSVGSIDNVVKEISDEIDKIKKKNKKEHINQIIIIVNSLSKLALYLGEDKVLDFLVTMNFLDTAEIPLLVFFSLNDSLHESLFINRVESLVDSSIVFKEDHQMEITENFFSLKGFGESGMTTKWYPCLDINEYGIIPVDSLVVAKSDENEEEGKEKKREGEESKKKKVSADDELIKRINTANAKMILKYCHEEGYIDHNRYINLKDDEEKLLEWIEKENENFKINKKFFRTGIWAIDRIFSDKDNLLGGMEHFYGIAIYHDTPPIDMHPIVAKIITQCLEDEKPFIEISIDDTPNVFLDSLRYSHKMDVDYKTIKEELLKEKLKSKFRFINSYGIEPFGDLSVSENIINIDNPYNVTIMFSKYKDARDSLKKVFNPEKNEIGPVIWLNSYTGLGSITSVENAYSFGVNAVMAQDVWSPEDQWNSLMLFSMQKNFLSPEDDMNLLQALDGTIEFSFRKILGNRIYYFHVPKMPKTNKTVPWTPYKIMKEKIGFLSLDEETIYYYLKSGVLRIKGRVFNG